MIRSATPDDAAAIAAIWNPIIRDTAITVWPTERSLDEVRDFIHARLKTHALLVAEQGGTVAGFATYKQFRDDGGYARSMEHMVYVAPGTQGSGLGRLLLTAVQDHARAAGHRLMIGGIIASNTASILFHERMGYAQWGRIPAAGWKFGQYHDLVLMGRDLNG